MKKDELTQVVKKAGFEKQVKFLHSINEGWDDIFHMMGTEDPKQTLGEYIENMVLSTWQEDEDIENDSELVQFFTKNV